MTRPTETMQPIPVIENAKASMVMRIVMQNKNFRIASWYRKKAALPAVTRTMSIDTGGHPITVYPGALVEKSDAGWQPASAGLQLLQPVSSSRVDVVFTGPLRPLAINKQQHSSLRLYDKPNGAAVATLQGGLLHREIDTRGNWRQIAVEQGCIQGRFWYRPGPNIHGLGAYGMCGFGSGISLRKTSFPAGACVYAEDGELIGVSLRDQECISNGRDIGTCRLFSKMYNLKIRRKNGQIEMCMSKEQARIESARKWKDHVYE